jgi:hypothetical protein
MSSDEFSGSPSGSSPGSISTSTFSSVSSGTASTTSTTPNPKKSKKQKISVEATGINKTIDDCLGFKVSRNDESSGTNHGVACLHGLMSYVVNSPSRKSNLSKSEPPVKEYKKSFSATQLARNWEKEQKERKGKQGITKG